MWSFFRFTISGSLLITAEDGSTRTVTVTFNRFNLAYINAETVKATYLRPDKNRYIIGEEVRVDVTPGMYRVLTNSSITYVKYLSGSTQVSAFRIKKMYSDASRFWFECKEPGNFDNIKPLIFQGLFYFTKKERLISLSFIFRN